MGFYPDYYINYRLKRAKIAPDYFNKYYSLENFSFSEINNFFKNYDNIEFLRAQSVRKNKEEQNESVKNINELFLKSLKKPQAHQQIKQKTLYVPENISPSGKDDAESLQIAIRSNDFERTEQLVKKGIYLPKRYNNISSIKNMDLLKLLINHEMIDFNNKNTYPKLSQFANNNYPLKEMIERGFDINAIDLSALKNCLSGINADNLHLQKTYAELLNNGLNPQKLSYNKNQALFFLTDKNTAQLSIDKGVDINHRKGNENLLVKIICDTQTKSADVLEKRMEVVELLLSNKAMIGESKDVTVENEKITELNNINPVYYDLLIKHNKIDPKKLSLSIYSVDKNRSCIEKIIINNRIDINNFNFGYLSSGGFIVGDLKEMEKRLGSIWFDKLISNAQKKNNFIEGYSNLFIEQCIFECRVDLLKKYKFKYPHVLSKKNINFVNHFGIEDGKITSFVNIKNIELYDWLKEENLLISKPQYNLNEMQEIPYEIGVKLYKDGFLTDELINPEVTNNLYCRKGALRIYAIEHDNLEKIKDSLGRGLLSYCTDPKEAKFLLARKSISLNGKINDYPVEIRDVIINKIKNKAISEKNEIISVLKIEEEPVSVQHKKRL